VVVGGGFKGVVAAANEAGNFAYNRFFAVGLFRCVGGELKAGWGGGKGGGGGGGAANEAGNFAYNRFFAVGLFRCVGGELNAGCLCVCV
jgi:hypothetical protein